MGKKHRRRESKRPRDFSLGPQAFEDYVAKIEQVMAAYDNLPEEQAALVGEYGWDRAIAAGRQFYGRWDECRKYLETERQLNERLRWSNKGVLPPGF